MVLVVGGGSWGTTLAVMAAHTGRDVQLLVRDAAVCQEINTMHTNSKYTGSIKLPENIVALQSRLPTEIRSEKSLQGIVILAIPTQSVRQVCESLNIARDAMVLVATKGMEQGSLLPMSEVVTAVTGCKNVVALSGPSFAMDLLEGNLAAATVGGARANVNAVIAALQNENFILEPSDDLLGVQACGAIKNVLGIACGIAVGLDASHNCRALLWTQAMREMTAFCLAMGGKSHTATLLCGTGDLFLSCDSVTSRNTKLGYDLARGQPHQSSAVEGYHMASVTHALATKLSLNLPLCHMVYRALFENNGGKVTNKVLLQKVLGYGLQQSIIQSNSP
jgi:glycerol-3-phosphate dehydrogenase (NAD(P)+)